MTGRSRGIGAAIGFGLIALAIGPAAAGAATFTSTSGLSAPPASGPSSVTVSGLEGTVTKVRASLNSVDHGLADDVDVLLVGPAGQSSILISDVVCGGIVDKTYTFDDAAALSATCTGGTAKPTDNTDFGTDGFVDPAPDGPFQADLSAFNNTPPNGTWSTFLTDDTLNAFGGGFNSWTLELETSGKAGVNCKGKPASYVGTADKDKITGTAGPDVIAGLGGKDKISGVGGKDTICGGAGKDTLRGGAGKDKLIGQDGKDKCIGGGGRDRATSCETEKSI